jgi:tellurite resistance protein
MPRASQLPIGSFGAVMGLAGLGLSVREAAPVLPGLVRAPAHLSEPWIALAALAFAWLLPTYLWKLVKAPRAVREEFANPVQMGFCATLPVGMTLLAGGLAPYLLPLAEVLWWAGAVLLLAMQAWGLQRLLAGGVELEQVNAGWMILFIGGIVVPGAGLQLGHDGMSRFAFGVSATVTPLVVGLVLLRALSRPALPAALRPSWFILLVPPALVYAHGSVLFRDFSFLESLYFFSLVLAAALLVYARGLARWPFGAPWWAITFPLDALAYAAARYAGSHPEPVWTVLCGATLMLAMLAVILVLVRSAFALREPVAARRG